MNPGTPYICFSPRRTLRVALDPGKGGPGSRERDDRQPVITPAQPGGPSVGNFHSIACRFNGKWVGIYPMEMSGLGSVPPSL